RGSQYFNGSAFVVNPGTNGADGTATDPASTPLAATTQTGRVWEDLPQDGQFIPDYSALPSPATVQLYGADGGFLGLTYATRGSPLYTPCAGGTSVQTLPPNGSHPSGDGGFYNVPVALAPVTPSPRSTPAGTVTVTFTGSPAVFVNLKAFSLTR